MQSASSVIRGEDAKKDKWKKDVTIKKISDI
jgi:hypothetical protein